MVLGKFLHIRNSQEFYVMERAIRMRWATLFAISHRTAINRAVNTTIVNTMVMLMYVLLQRSTDAACMPRKALGDVMCANIAMHGVNYHCMWYKDERLIA